MPYKYAEVPPGIRRVVDYLMNLHSIPFSEMTVAEADHEELSHPYAISLGVECLDEWTRDENLPEVPGYWRERMNHWCVAFYPDEKLYEEYISESKHQDMVTTVQDFGLYAIIESGEEV